MTRRTQQYSPQRRESGGGGSGHAVAAGYGGRRRKGEGGRASPWLGEAHDGDGGRGCTVAPELAGGGDLLGGGGDEATEHGKAWELGQTKEGD